MGYDDTLRDEPRTWAALVSRAGKTVRFTDADLRRLHQWEERPLRREEGRARGHRVHDGLARSGKLVLRLLLDDLVARRLLG